MARTKQNNFTYLIQVSSQNNESIAQKLIDAFNRALEPAKQQENNIVSVKIHKGITVDGIILVFEVAFNAKLGAQCGRVVLGKEFKQIVDGYTTENRVILHDWNTRRRNFPTVNINTDYKAREFKGRKRNVQTSRKQINAPQQPQNAGANQAQATEQHSEQLSSENTDADHN